MKYDSEKIAEQVHENGCAIIRKFVDPEAIIELQTQTKWLYS